MSTSASTNTERPWARLRSGFIVHPLYDGVFFIGAPILALIIGIFMADTSVATDSVSVFGQEGALSDHFIGSFIMAHLGLVLVRSHVNQSIFRLYPGRFVVIPLVLFAAILYSYKALVLVTVLATWWDVYHSSLQTFGLGRIYDRCAGNAADLGRKLDIGLNLLIYVGPILGGAVLMDHLESFDSFADIGWTMLASVPARAAPHRQLLTYIITAFGLFYLVVYLGYYARLWQRGYKVSIQKIALLSSTALCSLYAWGFNSFGEAFFVMNFFHALQYFAIVWWSENRNMRALIGYSDGRFGRAATLIVFLAAGASYGMFAHFVDAGDRTLICVTMTVSIMHFWYDGFIWSVRKKQV